MRATRLLVLVLCCAGIAAAQGDPLRDAIRLGNSSDAALLAAFDKGYDLAPSGTIDRAEVVTEFRRAVLFVRQHAQQGDFGVSAHDLTTALAPSAGLVTFIIQARLNPLNTYSQAPAYDLYIQTGPRSAPIAAKATKRDPVFPPGAAPGSSLVAVRLEASFSRADLEAAGSPTLVVTDDKADILFQTRIELARYR
jgi:hypothetical protein